MPVSRKRPAPPLASRAIRQAIALEADLREMAAVMNEARADAVPLSMSAMALDAIALLMPACEAALARSLVRRVETSPVSDDVLGVIFAFVGDRQTAARWVRGTDGAVRVEPGVRLYFHPRTALDLARRFAPALRLVCVQWARVAGAMTRKIAAPRVLTDDPLALAVAFPRATQVSTGAAELVSSSQRAAFEAVLADYAARGIRVSANDVRSGLKRAMRPINAHGHYGKGFFRLGGRCNFVGAALPVSAWASERDPTRIFATFSFGESLEPTAVVLAGADTVVFQTLRTPLVAGGFRARTVCFDLSIDFPGMKDLDVRFPTHHVCDLVDPARWVDGRRPAVCAILPNNLFVAEGMDAIRRLIAALAPLPVAVYAHQESCTHIGCGFPVRPSADFFDEFS